MRGTPKKLADTDGFRTFLIFEKKRLEGADARHLTKVGVSDRLLERKRHVNHVALRFSRRDHRRYGNRVQVRVMNPGSSSSYGHKDQRLGKHIPSTLNTLTNKRYITLRWISAYATDLLFVTFQIQRTPFAGAYAPLLTTKLI